MENVMKDEYANEPRLSDLPLNLMTIPRWLILPFIRFYQIVISPALPANTCRFYPSCSHYTYQSIYKYGVFRGTLLGAWRILRCNPFNSGGFDPVPMRARSVFLSSKKINRKNKLEIGIT